jgi:zinc transport system ATP-binding protein
MPQIIARNVSFGYTAAPVLEEVSVTIKTGDFVALIGPNGGGKSTFLKLLLGLLKPESGTISVMGKAPRDAAVQVGYVSQDIHLNRGFPVSVLDVVLMGLLERNTFLLRYRSDEIARAEAALQKVGMEAFARRKMDNLSGGQLQRVYIARALVSNPRILILDEPTSSIDAKGEQEIYDILRALNEEITVIVVSHGISFLLDYAKTILFINRRLTRHDAPAITKEHLIHSLNIKDNHLCEVELLNYLSGGAASCSKC